MAQNANMIIVLEPATDITLFLALFRPMSGTVMRTATFVGYTIHHIAVLKTPCLTSCLRY